MKLEILDSQVLYANPHQGDWVINAYHPRVLEVARGEVICAYRRGAALYSDDNRTYLARSTDAGRSWTDEGCVWDGSRDEQTYWYGATDLALMDDGEIVLSGFRIHRPTPDTLFYNEATGTCLTEETVLQRSRDGGRTWSRPEVIRKPEGMILEVTGPVVACGDGRWLLPFDLGKAYDDPTPLRQQVYGLCSTDRGKTWGETVRISGGAESDKTFWHARVVKLSDGRLMTFPWTGDRNGREFLTLHRVVSEDDGRTWGEPIATNVLGQTNHIVELPDGVLAMVYSYRQAEAPGIYLALSEDDGFTWDIENNVRIWDAYGRESLGVARTDTYPSSHDNIAFGAPHVERLSDGDLLATFWAGQSGQTVCRCARVRATAAGA